MKAIQTRYLGATNTRGSRIKAWADDWGSKTISYPHEYNTVRAHFEAAKALVDKAAQEAEREGRGFYADYPEISGGLPNGDWVFCYAASKV